MSMVHPYYHALIILSSTIDSTIAIQQSSVPNSSNYDAPVVTDLSNNNLVMMDDSLVSAQAPINVLSYVISQYMGTSTTNTSKLQRKEGLIVIVDKQQQVLDEIDALSDLDPQSDFNITTSSTAIDSNRLTTGTNNYQYIDTDPSRHISFYDTQQQPQIYPSCYRCNTVIYGNFTNCNK
ncbi:unnamed protein product [Rotaria magnacalcarata]|uniref:Uncharacterized protein n=1 Tax=Rotaria magnacalcarata TaxID=392030 RepID=A0A816MW65_9BILA|nr:unnamed protein product [Rotaria magnacalcarata]